MPDVKNENYFDREEDLDFEDLETLDEDNTRTMATTGLSSTVLLEDRSHFLVVIAGADEGCRIELSDEPLVIGRHYSVDLLLDDSEISSKHCTIQVTMGEVFVTDLDSKNGTFLDGEQITGTVLLPGESTVRVGGHVLRHEYRTRKEVEKTEDLEEDLKKAAVYVRTLLPPPLSTPSLEATWCYIPSEQLGGDAFGYHWIDDDHFAMYLIDVCGHGARAAMHSVYAINILRQQTLPNTDFTKPEDVLAALNRVFDMNSHGGMYFTTWYGVYTPGKKRMDYASAGHPPAFLVNAERSHLQKLRTKNLPTGTTSSPARNNGTVMINPGSWLYIFSDGVYEIETGDGTPWKLDDFQKVVMDPPQSDTDEPDRIYKKVEAISASSLDDDFSLLVIRFHWGTTEFGIANRE
jgi:serine phosphatase RsbU (regulator of sigma subunit)